MQIFDITLQINSKLAIWPGDTEFELRHKWKISEGAAVNLGSVTLSLHLGTHTDSPLHTENEGQDIASLELIPYIGMAQVIDVYNLKRIPVEVFKKFDLVNTPRVLLKTDFWLNHDEFPVGFPVIDEGVPEYLHSQGVKLLGLDVPSVDGFHSKEMTNHHSLNRYNIRILESLYLKEVPEGVYELIALPLKLCCADGSPVRAILRSL